MTDKFDVCHEITAKWEGGWSDHPADPGGKTMYGITQATLSNWLGRPASAAEIRNLSRAEAKTIYRDRYWKRVGGDTLPPGIDLCSALCAETMAEGARRLFRADLAVSMTGVGGPEAQDMHAPGSVYLGWAVPGEAGHEFHRFDGEPPEVLEKTATAAINLLHRLADR